MLTPEDKDLLVKKGISEQQIAEQLACFEKGFPFLKLDAAASVEKGIMAPAENEMKRENSEYKGRFRNVCFCGKGGRRCGQYPVMVRRYENRISRSV